MHIVLGFWCSLSRLGVPFGVLLARAMGDPAAQNWFLFWPRQRLRDFWFQVVSGTAFGKRLDLFLGCLEMSFVNDFEKILVFVRCVNSILTPDLLFPCYRHGRWHCTLEYAHLLSFLPRFHVISICLSYSLVVVLPLVCMSVFRLSKFCMFRSRACSSNCLRMHACVSACAFGL